MATKFLEPRVLDRISRECSEAVTEKRLVKVNATDHEQVDMVDTANTDKALGVAEVSGVAGEEISIATAGMLPVEAGGTIAAGDELVPDASGRVVARGTTATVLYQCVGFALSAAAVGETVMVQWTRYVTPGANAS